MSSETATPAAGDVIAVCPNGEQPGCLCAVCLATALGGDVPTKEQAQVIEADPHAPLLVVAGAGSGKTTTMADRVVWLCANLHVRPDQILGVTFTNKAASGLKRKVSEQLGKLAASGLVPAQQLITGEQGAGSHQRDDVALRDLLAPAVSTYNSYANSLLKQYGTLVGVEPHADLGGEARLWQLARSIVDRLGGPGYDSSEGPAVDINVLLEADRAPSTVTADLMKMSDQCAEHGQDPYAVAQWLDHLLTTRIHTHGEPPASPAALKTLVQNFRYRQQIGILAAHFDERRRQEGLLSYADQLTGAVTVAEQLERARLEQRSQYRVVLLDEFQDTSFVQSKLFYCLFGDGHSVTAVGDPNQSIYGFRGASAGQLFAFRDRFPTAAGVKPEVKYLTTAWRNGPEILTVANTLLSYFGQSETLQKPWHTATADEVSKLSGPQAQKRLTSNPHRDADDPGRVSVGWFETSAEEADAVVANLKDAYARVWQRRQRTAEASGKPPKRPTVAVLARTHRQLDVVAEAFDRQSVPGEDALHYERTGLSGLLSTPEVREVLCYLTVLADPTRSEVLIRILAGDKYRIGPRDLYALGQHAARLSRRFSTGDETEEQRTLLDALADLIRGRRAAGRPSQAGPAEQNPAQQNPADQGPTEHGISEEALQRMSELWENLSTLRQWSTQGITALVERVIDQIGLTAEVQAKHGGQSTGSHQLSAFIEESETFELTSPQGSLQDFLDWVETAEDQEKGLEPAEVESNPEAVQLMTMHAAKGLEWDIVATIGWRAPDFPDETAKDPWTSGGGWLPWPLRADAENLPRWGDFASGDEWLQDNLTHSWQVWSWLLNGKPAKAQDDWMPDPYLTQLPEFRAEEDRRLAYVAATRAADELIVSGSLFSGAGKGTDHSGKRRNQKMRPSQFLTEVAAAIGESEAIDAAEEGFTRTQNPASLYATEAAWPYDPLQGRTATRVFDGEGTAADYEVPERQTLRLSGASRREAVDAAAAWVIEALESDPPAAEPVLEEAAQWTEEAELILAQLAEGREDDIIPFPEHLSASNLVALEEDRSAALARLRRPIPQEPRAAFRRGTQTHSWIEERLGNIQQPAFESEDPGEDSTGTVFAEASTRAKFLRSPWAHRSAFALEMNFATPVGGTVIRGQIDAIYGYDPTQQRYLTLDDKDRYDRQPIAERNQRMLQADWHLVDWKTGSPPREQKVWEARKIQLAVYRLAFHRMYGIPLEKITASFHYVDQGESGETKTIPHQELPTAQRLEQLLDQAQQQFSR